MSCNKDPLRCRPRKSTATGREDGSRSTKVLMLAAIRFLSILMAAAWGLGACVLRAQDQPFVAGVAQVFPDGATATFRTEVPEGAAITVFLFPTTGPSSVAVGRLRGVPAEPPGYPVLFDGTEATLNRSIEFDGGVVQEVPTLGIVVTVAVGGAVPGRGESYADIDGDGESERLRLCLGTEGAHLQIERAGDGATSLLWHAYAYFGYDVEPDCP